MNFPAVDLRGLKAELLAIVAIMLGDFWFIAKAFEHRPHFSWAEFWMLLAFVQLVVSSLCWQILHIHVALRISAEQHKLLRQLHDQTRELHAETARMLREGKTRGTQGP